MTKTLKGLVRDIRCSSLASKHDKLGITKTTPSAVLFKVQYCSVCTMKVIGLGYYFLTDSAAVASIPLTSDVVYYVNATNKTLFKRNLFPRNFV